MPGGRHLNFSLADCQHLSVFSSFRTQDKNTYYFIHGYSVNVIVSAFIARLTEKAPQEYIKNQARLHAHKSSCFLQENALCFTLHLFVCGY